MENKLGGSVREYRLVKKITQKELGDLIGMPQSRISELESGMTRRLRPEMLAKISHVLGVSVDVLLK